MGFVWFWIVAVMIVAYVIFDGFDIGIGQHLFVRPVGLGNAQLLRGVLRAGAVARRDRGHFALLAQQHPRYHAVDGDFGGAEHSIVA